MILLSTERAMEAMEFIKEAFNGDKEAVKTLQNPSYFVEDGNLQGKIDSVQYFERVLPTLRDYFAAELEPLVPDVDAKADEMTKEDEILEVMKRIVAEDARNFAKQLRFGVAKYPFKKTNAMVSYIILQLFVLEAKTSHSFSESLAYLLALTLDEVRDVSLINKAKALI